MGKSTGTRGGGIFLDRELSDNAAEAASKFIPYLERGMEGETFAVKLLIGPHEAEFLLASNEDNRNIGSAKVAQFASDMRHGKWKVNGHPLVVAKTGELNDGQHRLMAVMQTGLTIPMMVSFGVDRETRDTIDIGKQRSTADHLSMKGFKYAASLASTARLVIAYEAANGRGIGSTGTVSSLEQQERVAADDLLRNLVVHVEKNRPPFMKTSLTAMSFYVLARIAPAEAAQYMNGIMSGVNLSASDPAYMVREKLLRAHEAGRVKTATERSKSLTSQGIIEVIFRGWNFFVTGKTVESAARIQARGALPLLRRPRTIMVDAEADSGDAPENFVPYNPTEPTLEDVRELADA